MNRNKAKQIPKPVRSNTKGKNINSYGYDVSKFAVLDIPVRRDPETGRLVTIDSQYSKRNH